MQEEPKVTPQRPPKATPEEPTKVTQKEPPRVTPEELSKEKAEDPPKVTPQSLVSENLIRATLTADKGPDAKILSWEVKDFTNKGDNYACVVTSASVRYSKNDKEEEVSYVAKCNPCRNGDAAHAFSSLVFEKEANFYDKLVPLVNAELRAAGMEPLRMAECYVTHLEKKEEVILLQDLRPEGFKMFDRKKGMDVAHTSLVLRELARLHAASTLVQAKMTEPMEEKYPFLKKDFNYVPEDAPEGMSTEVFEQMLYSNFKTGATMAEKAGGHQKVVDWMKKHSHQGMDLFEGCLKKSPPFDVLCHGDAWNNNILFKYNENGKPVDVRLLDLQICRKASPALDLNYLMYTSLNGPVRKDNLEAFLKTYYESFSEVLSQAGRQIPFTLEELKKEYHDRNLFGLLMCLFVVPLVVAEATDIMDFEEMTGDVEADIQEFQKKIKDSLDTNPLLRPRLLATFDDMVEYGVIS